MNDYERMLNLNVGEFGIVLFNSRRLLLSNYTRTLDGYLRTAMRQQLTDDDILGELQATQQRLMSLGGRL